METCARDSTEEWRLPAERLPPTVAELEARIDEAVTIARASEAAAIEIGAAAIESAEQAKRAADLALAASESAARGPDANGNGGEASTAAGAAPRNGFEDERMVIFTRRADRLGARFLRLQRR
jgi:hypothetical protein